jgi:hypothetical protein
MIKPNEDASFLILKTSNIAEVHGIAFSSLRRNESIAMFFAK